MPINKPQGLRGLKGLGSLSKAQYDSFINRNKDLISQHGYDPVYINNLYSNKQFIDRYGVDKFKAIPDIDMRNTLYKDDIVNTEFNKLYSPFNPDGTRNNKKGLGVDFEKYSQLSTDAKLKLMESNYLTPSEFESKWNKELKARETTHMNSGAGAFMPLGVSMQVGSAPQSFAGSEEAGRKLAFDKNQKILDKIYNDDVDTAAKRFSTEIGKVYSDISIAGMSDSQVKEAFTKAITPGSYKGNLGISEFASHINSSEMEDFSIDDMRQVLAKKKVYDANMSPEMAATALNNDAKRYITEHQGSFKKFGLFAKDVGISAMSYSADKINGIAELYRAGQDALAKKPVVMVDDKGNIIDSNKTSVVKDKQGNLHYTDNEGNIHPIHRMQVDYTTLHNMGKNPDGSDIKGAFGIDWMTLNPQYWTRAEQFGTLDEDEQKQYEKLGSSPYKVAYNPNEDSDIMYEAFKMMSFGLADAASQLIPYGVGLLGKSLSTASKVGNIARGFGKVLDTTGKLLTAETKVGQVAQGTAGALGIAYAYNRGAFQETLQQNLANAEDALLTTSRNDIYNRYNTNTEYKKSIDKLINEKANTMKQAYIAKIHRDGGMQIADMSAVDKMIHAKAQEAVLNEVLQNEIAKRKESKEYADLQQKAIDGAGDAAFNTFFPEAIKYGFVNTLGYRKFLYTNPAGLTKKVSSSLKGLKEITISSGKKRLATNASKFLTRADKLKEFGKTVGSQVWGGAWTNGTDDMQVDAAERINEDSFNRYLNAYQNGEALANTYGFADGLYSYMKGLQNSMGQETTLNAAVVGGLGSVVNFTPNFANIVRLATKEGREAYKNNFRRETERDDNSNPLKNEDGSVKYRDLGKWNDWRGQLNYFIQNGVLNTYYGKKQAERDLRSHADYVNNLLDEYNDFVDIEHLVASNIASENVESLGDQKTMDFIKALHAINTLDKLGEDSNDPTTMSSVVQNAKTLIEKASQLNLEEGKNPFSEEEISNLLSQYYASHPEIEQDEYTSQKALYEIAQNAQKLQKAIEAFDKAEDEIQKIEKNNSISISPEVRTKMKVQQALNGHWEERREKMQSEIDDSSSMDISKDARTIVASVGGVKNAQSLVKVYDKQKAEIEKELEEQKKKTEALDKQYNIAIDEGKQARREGNSDAVLTAQNNQKDVKAKLEASKEQESYLEDLIYRTSIKSNELQASMRDLETDAFKDTKDKVLTTDEIFSLDPIIRARMMKSENRDLYSKEQQREIEKLEKSLLMKDADALQKIQDIALLSQRISANQDAYSRMAKNPEAAAVELEAQRAQAAEAAYKLINQRNAESVADYVNQFDESMKGHNDITEDAKNQFIFKTLRKLNSNLLDIIDNDTLLPKYQQQVTAAKEWEKTVSDIEAVISQSDKSDEWKENAFKNIDNIVEASNTKEDILNALEKIIDDTNNSEASNDFEYLLEGMKRQGYQRDATILENRKQRKQREEDERKKKEDKQKKVEEESKKAADKKVEKQQEEDKVATSVDDVKELEDIDMGFDTTEKSTEDNKTQSVEEEDLHQTDDGIINASTLMLDNFGNGSIDMGDMWYATKDNPKKGKFYISREDDAITFWIDGIGIENYKDTLNIKPNEYEVIADEQNKDKNKDFIAISLRKMDGDWYFNGNFAGDKEHTQVKVSKDFNIDKAIERQQTEREMEFAAQGVDVDNKNIIDNGDTVQGNSESIEEQMQDITSDNVEVHISDDNIDAAEQNGIGQLNIENGANTLLGGNAMSRYSPEALEKDGVIVMKKGSDPTDHMNNYYAWMDAAGIKQQNIIDHELARIIQRNPHAKVKFLAVTPKVNATHDDHLKNDLFLVLDYDNNINKGITAIHNDSNGGVIESHGKKYLIIGTASYGNRNPDKQAVYNILFGKTKSQGIGLMVSGRVKYFNEHPDERFYVNDNLTTEIVPSSQIPGYIVRQTEKDSNPEFRSVRDLLADKERNPMGYNFNEVPWGIQELSQFLILKAPIDKVMVPRNPNRNSGSAFVLMPASNGKFVPSYLKVLKYNEMKDGALKDKVNTILQNVVSPNYKTRLQAVIDLSNIFYFDKDGDFILLRKKKDELSLSHNGSILKTFVLDSNFDRGEFMQAFEQMNPRVNITARVLQSPDLLEEYNEAGALMTDAALFGTAGSSYSIYGLDREGNMLIPGTPKNDTPKVANNSDFKKDYRSQIIFKHDYYTYDFVGDSFSINGKPITNESEIMQLRYNKRIIDNALTPAISKGIFDSYILSTGEHPTAIKVNRNTKEVKELTEKQTKELISQIEEEKAKKAREEAAQSESKANKAELTNVSEEIDLNDTGMVIDPNTGEAVQANTEEMLPIDDILNDTDETTPSVSSTTPESDNNHVSVENLNSEEHKETGLKFTDLINNKEYKMRILKLMKKKWKDAPKNLKEMENFLRDKNIEVDNIGTSKNDIEAWIKTMEDCR